MYNTTTEGKNPSLPTLQSGKPVKVMLEVQNIFSRGEYSVNIGIKSKDRAKEYIMAYSILTFTIFSDDRQAWSLHPDYKLTISDK